VPDFRAGERLALALAALLAGTAFSPLAAQQPASGDASARRAQNPLMQNVRTNPDAKMLVQADELVYDYENERVAAVGKVQIYYDGAVLEADRVTHDRKLNRLNATGNVRYQTKDGNVIHTDSIDLDADFRDGFIQSLLIETPDNTRIAAASAERSEGNITVLQSGAYTACEPCKDDPKKPPLWQVKAARIIHNERERVIHYENASVEFFGVPIAYFPYFWHPDPTVKRASGFLLPTFFSNSRTGVGVNIPYFWALAPNYDFTLNVAPMTRQIGPLVSGEWRHRLVNGSYSIRAAGIFQQDKEAFQDDDGGRTPGLPKFPRLDRNRRQVRDQPPLVLGLGRRPLHRPVLFERLFDRDRNGRCGENFIRSILPARASAPISMRARCISPASRGSTIKASCRSFIR
jgi:LPS-assembly protein